MAEEKRDNEEQLARAPEGAPPRAVDDEMQFAIEAGPMAVTELLNKREEEARRNPAGGQLARPISDLRAQREAEPERKETPREEAERTYWESDRVRGARNALDVWASCKHARLSGCGVAVPTLETIFEIPRPEVKYVDALRGRIVEEEIMVAASTSRIEARPRVIELGVDLALWQIGASPSLTGLLLELYPRCGPYERPAYSRDLEHPEGAIIRAYRPSELRRVTGALRGPNVQKKVDSLLVQLHREAIESVAVIERMPADVLERHILRVLVPEGKRPRGRPRNLLPDWESQSRTVLNQVQTARNVDDVAP